MDDFDITNDVYHKRKRNMVSAIKALSGDILGACLMILAIGIPFAIYFWRM
ncbi:hypothetical protein UFOVP907_43 [uncultured Caudovirales phage]|uniref:Uncharacterized protein n=1 Tax=uncultured Caudovirales phage TaxID=2100421 RepID=A0A6J5PDU9_9CAUD|nr:hypothetical protein UFOVP907_43 [uncultured Caudovirales phage]